MSSIPEFIDGLKTKLDNLESTGLYKHERALTGAQQVLVHAGGKNLLNFCSNNYLGLANNDQIIAASKTALDQFGFGMASVRFIAGTQTQHVALEDKLTSFLSTQATILFPSCFDANGGLFEAIFDENDAIISDALNHASIIDGIRLCKAQRFRCQNRDLADLEIQLQSASKAKNIVIVTDGVFSMDGYLAPLVGICDLADKYGALVMVDDSHATGFIGAGGAGTPTYWGVQNRVDIISGTLGKALGGASGGFISSRHPEIVQMLRQKARPYLFSNSVPPSVVAGTIAALDLMRSNPELAVKVRENAREFRALMVEEGFDLLPGEHAIVPVMFSNEHLAVSMAKALFDRGIYAVAFSYPVVPMGKARIRIQLSASHTFDEIRECVKAFVDAREELSVKIHE
ncbi:MAG: glycine C-acetyltransferase [Candidatus Planktophila sp.]|nr:glycine C-acetyltransferase [Candidatus Planktophila sp.]